MENRNATLTQLIFEAWQVTLYSVTRVNREVFANFTKNFSDYLEGIIYKTYAWIPPIVGVNGRSPLHIAVQKES